MFKNESTYDFKRNKIDFVFFLFRNKTLWDVDMWVYKVNGNRKFNGG